MITCDLKEMPNEVLEYTSQLEGRSMLVRKCDVVKCEAIVRGYLTGSALKEYQQSQTIHGISLPPNLKESAKFDKPLFTPSTKAEVGSKDENIHPDQRRWFKPVMLKPNAQQSIKSCLISHSQIEYQKQQ